MIAGAQGVSSAAWGQLQMQQAQRNADQAEQRARALQSQAQAAQQEADQAQNNARELQGSSSAARNDADSARRNVRTMQAFGQVSGGLGELRGQIAQTLSSAELPVASPVVKNADGQVTGTLINVTA